MSRASIVTPQFVEISHTPASVGERIAAQLIDWVAQGGYIFLCVEVMKVVSSLDILGETAFSALIILLVFLPVTLYCPVCEVFFRGQTLGKMLMRIRVVMADGSAPTIGSALMRWLLFFADGPTMGGLGVLVMALNSSARRLGDMAAGTLVVKTSMTRPLGVSLSDYSHLREGYKPAYPQAADLSLEQASLISTTLELPDDDPRIAALAQKVKSRFGIDTYEESSDAMFLWRVTKDFQYFALEEV